jgi:transposase
VRELPSLPAWPSTSSATPGTQALAGVLLQSPTEHGFGSGLWTLKRVGVVVQRMFGVEFSLSQIWRIPGGLGFSVHKPE